MAQRPSRTGLWLALSIPVVALILGVWVVSQPTPTPAPTATPVPTTTPIPTTTPVPTVTSTPPSTSNPGPLPTVVVPDITVTSERVTAANVPVSLAFAPDERLFYNELTSGRIRVYAQGQTSTFAQVKVFTCGEFGLLGLAIDPEFQVNHYLYVYFIEPVDPDAQIGHPVIMRFTDVEGKGEDPTVIVSDLPNTTPGICAHVGGNIHFGPDGYLYVTIGDMQFWEPNQAQDIASPRGKMLRIDKSNGSAAPDNPFVSEPGADPRVFAYGLRNTFNFTFHPQSGGIYAPENGLGNCDELNIIEAGENYGHPIASIQAEEPPCLKRAGITPIYLYARPDMRPEVFTSNVAPTGVHFVSGDVYPSLGDSLLSCEFNTGFMRRLLLAGPTLDYVADDSIVVQDCNLNVTTDSQGVVYYSNWSEIRRLVPASEP